MRSPSGGYAQSRLVQQHKKLARTIPKQRPQARSTFNNENQETWECTPKGSRGRPQTFVCFHCPLVASAEAKFLRNAANPYRKSIKTPPHNSAARLAMSFPPSASCKFLDLPPVNLRNLHLHLTKNPFVSRPPHLCGVTLAQIPQI